MANATAQPRASATKAPARAKATPSPLPAEQPDQGSGQPDQSEVTVAVAAADLVRLAGAHHAHNMGREGAAMGSVFGSELVHQALNQLEGLIAGEPQFPGATAFHAAAAMVAGSLAIDKAERPGAAERHSLLDQALTILDSAAISFSFDQQPCEALATGLQAGAMPFRHRPQPQIRQLDDGHTPEQLRTVLEFVAGAVHTQSNILMMAQTSAEQWERTNLVDAAQAMARQIGAAADSAIGGEVLGTMTRWNYGPIFDSLGKAGAA